MGIAAQSGKLGDQIDFKACLSSASLVLEVATVIAALHIVRDIGRRAIGCGGGGEHKV